MPDNYGIKVYLHGGEIIDEDVAEHFVDPNRWFVFCTKEDEWVWVPTEAIKKVTHDKRWSKVVAIRRKMQGEGKK